MGFTRTAGRCFYASTSKLNWTDAEAACQIFGDDVHLATLDTQQVAKSMFYWLFSQYWFPSR